MPELKEQLEIMQKIISTDKVLTKDDTARLLKAIFAIMNEFKKDAQKLNKDAETHVEQLLKEVVRRLEKNVEDVKGVTSTSQKEISVSLGKTLKAVRGIKKEIMDAKPKDGEKGDPGEDGSPDTPEEVRDKLEGLPKGKKLSIQAIDELPDAIEELYKMAEKALQEASQASSTPVRASGSAGRLVRFIDDETPTGTLDGANTDFTLSKTPLTGSLKVYRNGSRQRITEDYTLDYRTITFGVAPESDEIILVDYRY